MTDTAKAICISGVIILIILAVMMYLQQHDTDQEQYYQLRADNCLSQAQGVANGRLFGQTHWTYNRVTDVCTVT